MIIRALDSSNDFSFGKGKSNYLKETAAIGLDVKTRVYSFLNDCFFALDDGIDWYNLIGLKDTKAIILAVKTTILQSYGVTGIISFDTIYEFRSLTLKYEIRTIFNERVVDNVEVLQYA
jgi:hypothetical protein